MLLQARLQRELDTLDNSEDRAGLERQIAEAQAQRAQLQDSADVATDALQHSASADESALQMAQEMNAELEQSIQTLGNALETDHAPQTDHAPRIDHAGQFATPRVSMTFVVHIASSLDVLPP